MSGPSVKERLGGAVERMVRLLNARRHQSMAETMKYLSTQLSVSPDAVYKWRSGDARPNSASIARLVEIGVLEAGMERTWAQEVLLLSQHPQASSLLAHLFPTTDKRVLNNLPRRPFGPAGFIDREAELREIEQRLSPERREWIISIEGSAGIGKSALALEAAWRAVENYARQPSERRFDAVVWVSAQHVLLTASGLHRQRADRTGLKEIYDAIADVLDHPEIRQQPTDDHAARASAVDHALRGHGRVLIVLDSLEQMAGEDHEEILEFVRSVPYPAKVIVTSRFREDIPFPLRLAGLPKEPMHRLLLDQAAARGVSLSDAQIKQLLAVIDGVPRAATFAVGLMAMKGYDIEHTLRQVCDHHGDLSHFLLNEAMNRLEADAEAGYSHDYDVLRVLSFFAAPPDTHPAVIARILDLSEPTCRGALARLANLGLVEYSGPTDSCYMLTLTRTYIQEREAERDPHWERKREAWVSWFVAFARQHAGADRPEWSRDFDLIEREWPQFQAVFAWCLSEQRVAPAARYAPLKTLWLDAGALNTFGLLTTFAEIYGYWSDQDQLLEQLRPLCELQQDWPAAVRALAVRARFLALMRRLDAADALLEQAREHLSDADWVTRCEIALDNLLIATYRREPARVRRALTELRQLAERAPGMDPEREAHLRERYVIQALYYEAILRQEEGRLAEAAQLFGQMTARGEAIAWPRAVIHALGRLAEVRIAQGDLREARELLDRGYHLLEHGHKDISQLAAYKSRYAFLARAEGDRAATHRWANEALGLYDQFGMHHHTARMLQLIEWATATR